MKNNRIYFVTPSIKTGGGNRVFIELANQLCKNNEVIICYPNNSKDINTFEKNPNVKYVTIGKYKETKLGKLLNLFKTIKYLNVENEKSIFIISDPIFSLLTFLMPSKQTYRFIQADDYRIFDDGALLGKGLILKIYKLLCKLSYKDKINFIFNSLYTYNQFIKDSKREDIPYSLVYPALNHDIFYENTQETYNNKDVVNICLIARKHPWKGLETFIKVYQALDKMIQNRICVTLISHDNLSNFDTDGMQIIKPTSDHQIANIYRNSDIFISTSWWEGFGLPPLEAMACGCSVITSDSGGINEYAVNHLNCLIYPPKDIEQLKQKLILLIEKKELREKLIYQGFLTVKKFNWDESAEQLFNIIYNKNEQD